jgi:alkylation response protein AidB-like acyl-CoA dehydrogenase
MDLSYGKEYEDFRREVRDFLGSNWPPGGDADRFPTKEETATFRDLATERGYLRRSIPKQYGGSDQPPDEIRGSILREEFSRLRAPMDPPGIGMMMLVPTLLERGEEWQKQKFVPPTARGDVIWCQGYSEPGSGSDLASLKTRGELVGDEWVINGQKIWTSGARDAHYMFCLTRTEPEQPKHAGISYLLLDMKQPGIDVRPLKQMTGGADFNEVFFTDARTPKDWIVGKRGEGWLVSRTTLKHERNSIGAAAQSNALFQGLIQLAKSTQRSGRPNIDDPAIRQRLAEIEGYVRAHEYSGFRQLTKNSRGENPGIIQMMNKLNSTNIGDRVAKLALDLLEEDGLLDPIATPRAGYRPSANRSWITQYMYSLGIAVAGGTANIQRNVIGERGLGLPRDVYAERSSGK